MLLFDLFEDIFVVVEMFMSFRVEIEHVIEIFDDSLFYLIFDSFPSCSCSDEANLFLDHVYHHFATVSVLEVENCGEGEFVEYYLFVFSV